MRPSALQTDRSQTYRDCPRSLLLNFRLDLCACASRVRELGLRGLRDVATTSRMGRDQLTLTAVPLCKNLMRGSGS